MEKRKEKGLKLFKEGRVKKIMKDHYVVQGSKKYFVKKVSGYWSCTCKDHFYRLEICKHIEGCKDYERNKVRGTKKPKFFNNRVQKLKMSERAISEQIDKILKANKEHFKRYKTKDEDLKKKHRRLHKKLVEVREELERLQPPKMIFICLYAITISGTKLFIFYL